jgi:hypothetical protein
MSAAPDPGLCGGPDNELDGCGVSFRRMTADICALCKKLRAPGQSAEQCAALRVCVMDILVYMY